MTKQEFNSILEAHKKLEWKRTWPFVLTLICWAGLTLGAIVYAEKCIDLPDWAWPTLAVVNVAALFGYVFFQAKRVEPMLRSDGLVCPSCDKVIKPPEDVKIVVATHNCPHCGEKIITEPGHGPYGENAG